MRRLITSDTFVQGEEVLLCPVCRFEYVHPLSVKVATGLDLTVVDENGTEVHRGVTQVSLEDVSLVDHKGTQAVRTKLAESLAAHRERGVRIIIEYHCENGHHGNLIFQFHKGNIYVKHEILEPLEEWTPLWRT